MDVVKENLSDDGLELAECYWKKRDATYMKTGLAGRNQPIVTRTRRVAREIWFKNVYLEFRGIVIFQLRGSAITPEVGECVIEPFDEGKMIKLKALAREATDNQRWAYLHS